MTKVTIVFLLLIAVLGAFAAFAFRTIQPASINILKNKFYTGLPKQSGTIPTRTHSPKLEYSVWIPWWDEKRALTSLEITGRTIKLLSPVWFVLEPSGYIKKTPSKFTREIVDEAISSGYLLFPTIGNDLDGKRVSMLINNQEKVVSETEKLIQIALTSGYKGWDIDWEEIPEEDRDAFSDFISYFSNKLHLNDLLLSVTVHAQTGSQDDWRGVKGQDWPTLGKHADFVRIMAYDFHNSDSGPGAITPADKLASSISFAISVIPVDKIVIGLPTYGYDWGEGKGEPLQYEEIMSRLTGNKGTWSRDESSGELVGKYRKAEVEHTIWFQDKESVVKKVNISRSYGIYKFIFWSLGGEDKSMWEKDFLTIE